jgi:hypothetical protein
LPLQSRKQFARTLHGDTLVIEAQAMQTAKLGTVTGAAGATMVTLWHDDAVAGMAVCNGRLNGQNASVRSAKFGYCPR